MLSSENFVADKPTWCAGCGDFGVLKGIQQAVANLNRQPKDIVMVSGIGCSGKITSYFHSYGFHVMHGRTLPVATGVKLANQDLTVIAAGGDGDGYGIGLNHLIHTIRRNVNITYIVMNNDVYGNTKGQTAPTSDTGFVSSSTPFGAAESPIRPLSLALSAGATYVAQGISNNLPQLTRLIEEGIKHDGFSLINVFSPCLTYDKVHTYLWYRDNIVNLDDNSSYQTDNRALALAKMIETEELCTGLIFQESRPSYERMLPNFSSQPLVKQDITSLHQEYYNLMEEEFAGSF